MMLKSVSIFSTWSRAQISIDLNMGSCVITYLAHFRTCVIDLTHTHTHTHTQTQTQTHCMETFQDVFSCIFLVGHKKTLI
jgi:hypothetical protein